MPLLLLSVRLLACTPSGLHGMGRCDMIFQMKTPSRQWCDLRERTSKVNADAVMLFCYYMLPTVC